VAIDRVGGRLAGEDLDQLGGDTAGDQAGSRPCPARILDQLATDLAGDGRGEVLSDSAGSRRPGPDVDRLTPARQGPLSTGQAGKLSRARVDPRPARARPLPVVRVPNLVAIRAWRADLRLVSCTREPGAGDENGATHWGPMMSREDEIRAAAYELLTRESKPDSTDKRLRELIREMKGV